MLRFINVVKVDQAGGSPPVRLGSLEAWTEVREPKTDQEAGRFPVMPVPLTSMFCRLMRADQAEGRLPETRESPLKLRKDRVESVDQDEGRLPEYPPFPTLRDTKVLTWLMGKGKGRAEKVPPAAVPEPFPGPLTVPIPGILDRSTLVTIPL